MEERNIDYDFAKLLGSFAVQVIMKDCKMKTKSERKAFLEGIIQQAEMEKSQLDDEAEPDDEVKIAIEQLVN